MRFKWWCGCWCALLLILWQHSDGWLSLRRSSGTLETYLRATRDVYSIIAKDFHKLPRHVDSADLRSTCKQYPLEDILTSLGRSKDWVRLLEVLEVQREFSTSHSPSSSQEKIDDSLILCVFVDMIDRFKENSIASTREVFIERLIAMNMEVGLIYLCYLHFIIREVESFGGVKDSFETFSTLFKLQNEFLSSSEMTISQLCSHPSLVNIFTRPYQFENVLRVCRELIPLVHESASSSTYADKLSSLVVSLSVITATDLDLGSISTLLRISSALLTLPNQPGTSSQDTVRVLSLIENLSSLNLRYSSALGSLREMSSSLCSDPSIVFQCYEFTSKGSADRSALLLLAEVCKHLSHTESLDSALNSLVHERREEMHMVQSERSREMIGERRGKRESKDALLLSPLHSNIATLLLSTFPFNGSSDPITYKRQSILIFGDGDLSFSVALFKELNSRVERSAGDLQNDTTKSWGSERTMTVQRINCSVGAFEMVSSTLCNEEDLTRMYSQAAQNIQFLNESDGARVVFGLNVYKTAFSDVYPHLSPQEAVDWVLFNFPYSDTFEDDNTEVYNHMEDNRHRNPFRSHWQGIGRHQKLLRGIFASFVEHFSRGSEGQVIGEMRSSSSPKLVITLLLSQSRQWAVESVAHEFGLKLTAVRKFSMECHSQYGYSQRRTNVDTEFTQKNSHGKKYGPKRSSLDAWSFVFERKDVVKYIAPSSLFEVKRYPADFIVIEDRVISSLLHPCKADEDSWETNTTSAEDISHEKATSLLREMLSSDQFEELAVYYDSLQSDSNVTAKGIELHISPELNKTRRTLFHKSIRVVYQEEVEVRCI